MQHTIIWWCLHTAHDYMMVFTCSKRLYDGVYMQHTIIWWCLNAAYHSWVIQFNEYETTLPIVTLLNSTILTQYYCQRQVYWIYPRNLCVGSVRKCANYVNTPHSNKFSVCVMDILKRSLVGIKIDIQLKLASNSQSTNLQTGYPSENSRPGNSIFHPVSITN